jgi:hypothetical protein
MRCSRTPILQNLRGANTPKIVMFLRCPAASRDPCVGSFTVRCIGRNTHNRACASPHADGAFYLYHAAVSPQYPNLRTSAPPLPHPCNRHVPCPTHPAAIGDDAASFSAPTGFSVLYLLGVSPVRPRTTRIPSSATFEHLQSSREVSAVRLLIARIHSSVNALKQ